MLDVRLDWIIQLQLSLNLQKIQVNSGGERVVGAPGRQTETMSIIIIFIIFLTVMIIVLCRLCLVEPSLCDVNSSVVTSPSSD